MKKILIIFLLSFIHQLKAQTRISVPIDSVRVDVTRYADNNIIQSVTVNYDTLAAGLVMHGSAYDFDSIFTATPVRNYHEYDENKNETKYQLWKEKNNSKKIYVDEYSSFNEEGQLLFHYKKKLNGYQASEHYIFEKDSCTYNSFDSISIKYYEGYTSKSNIHNYGRIEYSYYPDRRVSQTQRFNRTDTSLWVLTNTTSYYYGVPDIVDYGNIRFLYFKNERGLDTALVYQTKNQTIWQTEQKTTFEYNSFGSIIKNILWYDPLNWEIEEIAIWDYNDQNQLLSYDYTYNGGGGSSINYNYYSNGRLKSSSFFSSSSMGDFYSREHNYSYQNILPISPEDFEFSIYPNPAYETINILLYSPINQIHKLLLYNSIGQLIKSETLEIPSGYAKIEIPISNISKGFYFLSISDGEQVKTKKIMIAE